MAYWLSKIRAEVVFVDQGRPAADCLFGQGGTGGIVAPELAEGGHHARGVCGGMPPSFMA